IPASSLANHGNRFWRRGRVLFSFWASRSLISPLALTAVPGGFSSVWATAPAKWKRRFHVRGRAQILVASQCARLSRTLGSEIDAAIECHIVTAHQQNQLLTP